MFWKKWFKKNQRRPCKFDADIAEIKAVQINSLKSAFSSDMTIFKVHSYFARLEEYNVFLRRMLDTFRNDQLIYAIQLPTELYEVSLSDLYLDKQGRYTNTDTITEEFFSLVIELLTIYDQKETQLDKTFEIEKNLLLLQYIVANLLTLYREIINGRSQRSDSSIRRRNSNRYIR